QEAGGDRVKGVALAEERGGKRKQRAGDEHRDERAGEDPAATAAAGAGARYSHPTCCIRATAWPSAGPARSTSIGSSLTSAQSRMCSAGATAGLAANSLFSTIASCASR